MARKKATEPDVRVRCTLEIAGRPKTGLNLIFTKRALMKQPKGGDAFARFARALHKSAVLHAENCLPAGGKPNARFRGPGAHLRAEAAVDRVWAKYGFITPTMLKAFDKMRADEARAAKKEQHGRS